MNKFVRTLVLSGEYLLSGFKYLLAIFMIFSGVTTAIGPLTPMDGAFGFIYASRIALVSFGVIFVGSGLALLLGKIRKSRRWTGRGLMAIYMCFLFSTILQGMAYSWAPGFWVGNFVATLVVGALWLRWKFQTEYIKPGHFRDDVIELRE